MRSIQNKVVDATKKAVEVGKQSVGEVGAQVARDVLQKQVLDRYSEAAPSVSHKRPRRKRRAPTASVVKKQKKKPRRRKNPSSFDVFDS